MLTEKEKEVAKEMAEAFATAVQGEQQTLLKKTKPGEMNLRCGEPDETDGEAEDDEETRDERQLKTCSGR